MPMAGVTRTGARLPESRSRASNCSDYLCLLLHYDVGKVLLIKRYVLIDLSGRVHVTSSHDSSSRLLIRGIVEISLANATRRHRGADVEI